MRPVPELAGLDEFNEIISRLNEFVFAPPKDDVSRMRTLKNIQARASQLRSVNEALGCSALGGVAAAMGQLKESRRLHEMSIQQLTHPGLYANYATSLMNLQEWRSAYQAAEKSMELEPSRGALEIMLKAADRMGDESLYEYHEDNYRKLFGEQSEYDANRQSRENFELTMSCMMAASESFADILSDPEEDEAWANL